MAFKFNNNPRNYGISYTTVEQNQKIPANFGTPQMQDMMQSKHESREDEHGSLMIDINSSVKLSEFIQDEMDTDTDKRESIEEGSGFSKTEDIDDALRILNEGEKDILEKVKKKSEDIVAKNTDLMPVPFGVQRDVEGNYFDVGLHLAGEPEAFYKERDQMVADKVVTVHIQSSYLGHVSGDDVIENVIVMLAAIRIMEIAGYSVGINLYWLSRNHHSGEKRNFFCRYRIKSPKEPLNLQRLVGTAHPGFFRRILFRVKELTDCDPSGYGSSLEGFSDAFEIDKISKDVKKIIKQAIGEEKIEQKETDSDEFFKRLPF